MRPANGLAWKAAALPMRRILQTARQLAALWLLACALTLVTLTPAWAGSQSQEVTAEGVSLHVEFNDTDFAGGTEPLVQWIRRSLGIVNAYYGQFPTNQLQIRVEPEEGEGVRSGRTWGYHGGLIRVQVGRKVTAAQLKDDWVLVHEMTHLALPDVGDEQGWLSEGLAVYIEGVARVQAGNRTQQDVFAEQLKQMPRGLPISGDQGLDHTHTWARTYWGGAMFCLLADVEIHRRTQNRLGLQEAMRAVARESGGLAVDWPIQRVLDSADHATGTSVLHDMYQQMKDHPVTPDLPQLWAQLGVFSDGTTIQLRDDAPMAAIRRAIMQPHHTGRAGAAAAQGVSGE